MGRWKANKGKNPKEERNSGVKTRILGERKEELSLCFASLITAYVGNRAKKQRKGGKIFRAKVERFSCEGKMLAGKRKIGGSRVGTKGEAKLDNFHL